MLPTKEEFNEWRSHPCSVWVRQVLGLRREAYRQEWEGGSFSDLSAPGYAIRNAAQVGECRGLAFAQEMEYESFFQEIENVGEQERAEAAGQGGVDTGVYAGEEGGSD